MITKYKGDFGRAETDEQRADILRVLLLRIAKDVGLVTAHDKLIDVKFKENLGGFDGIFYHDEPFCVYLSSCYFEKNASVSGAISTYLHECAHCIIANFTTLRTDHCFLFYAVNLAINIRFYNYINNLNPYFYYSWTSASLRIYNIYEDQEFTEPLKIDGEKLGKRMGEATHLAFVCAQNNEPLFFGLGVICAYYNQKLIKEKKRKETKQKIDDKLKNIKYMFDIFLKFKWLMTVMFSRAKNSFKKKVIFYLSY